VFTFCSWFCAVACPCAAGKCIFQHAIANVPQPLLHLLHALRKLLLQTGNTG
jgi:hypothetical protein